MRFGLQEGLAVALLKNRLIGVEIVECTKEDGWTTVGVERVKVKEGVYKGALCTIEVTDGRIRVLTSEKQIELLRVYKNYEFHFDDKGNFAGTGTGVCARFRNLGEICDRENNIG